MQVEQMVRTVDRCALLGCMVQLAGFSWLGLRRAVAIGASGELALQRAGVFEMRVAGGNGGGRFVAGC